MAGAIKHLLLNQTRRDCCINPCLINLLSRQFFSSESDSNVRVPLPIEPVSYQPKPKLPPSEEEEQLQAHQKQQSGNVNSENARSWSRDELRYMKDTSVVSPVSYPTRVAPLPEDKMQVSEDKESERREEFDRETRVIEEAKLGYMRRMGVLRYGKQEDDEGEGNLPFPTMIKAENAEKNEKTKKSKVVYDLKEAIRLVKANARPTFDETLEAHVKMTPDLRRTDLKLSGFVRLPHGFGKTYRVAVFAEGAAADEARDAGADIVGGPELVESIRAGELKVDFDKCISTPSMMLHVKKLSRNLRQLMPDYRKGTVTDDLSRTVKEAKEQSVLFKKDKTAIVHVGLGKVSFSDDALRENVGAFINALLLAKPAGLKKSSKYAGYVDSFHICSTMGRSFPITIASLSMAADRYTRLQLQ